MSWQDITGNVVRGLNQAAGNDKVVASMDQTRFDKNQAAAADQQRNTLPYSMAIKGLLSQLATIDKTQNPTAYNAIVDQIQPNVQAIREIFHPDAKLGGGDWLKTHTTDRLHITNHDARVKSLQAQTQAGVMQDANQSRAFAQGVAAPINPYQQKMTQLTAVGVPQDQALAVATGMEPKTEYDKFAADYKQRNPNSTQEDVLKAYTAAKETPKALKGMAFDAGTGQVKNQDTGQRYSSTDKNLPPEVASIFTAQSQHEAARQAEIDKKQQEVESRFERTLNARQQNEGTWGVAEGEGGKTILLNSKTGEEKDAPSGLHKSGYYAKQIAPLEAASLNISSYMDGKVFDGAGDLALQHEFFTATQPATGFRMTKVQQDILQNSQSWLNSVEAKAQHFAIGTWFSEKLRQQIADAAKQAIEAKKKSLSGSVGGAGTEQLRQAQNGASLSDDDIIKALNGAH